MRALAIDLGGTHATCALVAEDGIAARQAVRARGEAGLGALLPALSDVLRNLLRQTGTAAADCAGLALAFCGIVDAHRGRVLSTNKKYDDACALDLPAWSQQTFGLPLRLENDARMALLGERYAGAGRCADDLVMITLGTGIGGAAMIAGRLLHGKHFQAGCLGGHLPVAFAGHACSCGNIGCVEAEASTWALPRICREWPGFPESALASKPNLDFAMLLASAEARDRVAAEVLEHCTRVWAAAAVALIHAYDPEVVIFGGGVMRSASAILPAIERHVRQHAWTPWGQVQVRAAELGNDAALLGAIPLLGDNT